MNKDKFRSIRAVFSADASVAQLFKLPQKYSNPPSGTTEQLGNTELRSWCRLIRERRWTPLQKRALLAHYETPQAILAANPQLLTGLGVTDSKQFPQSDLNAQVDQDLLWLDRPAHHLITFGSPQYPALLKEISDPPIALFAIGEIGLINKPQVAIVGSRKPTPIGARVTQQIAEGLADVGVLVTSGMALGVDGIAHAACLQRNEPTIAVLGCGLDIIYPSRNKGLYESLCKTGLLLSEYPLGFAPTRYSFPQRNRIVSGLSHGVVIVEAAKRSGTLITARLSIEQNRELMVVPGSALSSQYEGSHRLIREGACLVTCSLDVLQQLSLELISHTQSSSNNEEHKKVSAPSFEVGERGLVLSHMGADSTCIDDIIRGSGLTPAKVSSILLELELDGVVAIASDGGYVNLS